MMKNTSVAVVFAGTLVLTTMAQAGPIIQDVSNAVYQVLNFAPIGQTFTAEDPHVTVGFRIGDLNPAGGAYAVGMALYEGIGVGGSLLGSSPEVSFPDFFLGWYDADFSAVTLTAGQVYTGILTSPTVRAGVSASMSDLYSGGSIVLFGSPVASVDARFRVLPVNGGTPVVPAPGAILLGTLGTGLVGWLRRRRTL